VREPAVAVPIDSDKEVCPSDDIGLFVIDVIVESLGEAAEVPPLVGDEDVPTVVGEGPGLVGEFGDVEGAVLC
jgi:hypothetical protein